jgi:hypothetical protein
MERLNDDDLKGEELSQEIIRAQAMCGVAGQIIAGGRLILDAAKAADDCPGIRKTTLLADKSNA